MIKGSEVNHHHDIRRSAVTSTLCTMVGIRLASLLVLDILPTQIPKASGVVSLRGIRLIVFLVAELNNLMVWKYG